MDCSKIKIGDKIEVYREKRWFSAEITSVYDAGYIIMYDFVREDGDTGFDKYDGIFLPRSDDKCPACKGEKEFYVREIGKMCCHFCNGSGLRNNDEYDFSI